MDTILVLSHAISDWISLKNVIKACVCVLVVSVLSADKLQKY